MAYVSAVEGFGTAASVIHDDPAHPNVIDVPNTELLAPGHLRRAGPDLLLTDRDGKHYVIPGYFSTEHPPALVAPNGGGLPGDLVTLLSGSPTPNEYAQAQPTAPPGAIGKVEKVIGDVTAIRNGVAVAVHVGDVVYQSDVIQTGVDSRVGIGFPDGTALELTANTRMALSEYSYDAHSTSNSALLTLVQGTFAFVAGNVAHTGDMKISTPVATMGIRGTTGYVLDGHQFVLVDDYATTHHGEYDLYRVDQNGNIVLDQNGLPTILATVSQTEFVTDCQLNSCSTTPMSDSLRAFTQQIIPGLFQTYVINNQTTPHTNPGGNGSSEPLFEPSEPQNPQLIQLHGPQDNINTPTNGPSGGTTQPIQFIVTTPPPLPPPTPHTNFAVNTLIEYYFYPNFGTNYFTSAEFIPPASGIEANPDLGGAFFLAVTDNSITASDFTFNGTFTAKPFNGFEVVDLNGNPDISGVTIDASSNMAGLTSSDIFFDSNAVWVNWAGLSFNTNTVVKLDITFDPPLEPTQVSLTQTLDGSAAAVSNTQTLTVSDGTELALLGTINNSGVIAVDGAKAPTAIGVDGNVTLQGGGQVVLSDSDQNYIFGHGILTNVNDTISGGGDIGNGTLIFHNEGVVEAQGAYALIVDTGTNPFINTGTIEANGGTLIVDSPVTGGGNAVVAGGIIEFTGASDNNVSFNGSAAGMLALDQSQHFTGHIVGFAGADQIDLGDIAYSSNFTLSYTAEEGGANGILTVSDGSHTASLDLVGDYTTSSFATSSDGHGGTILADASVVTADQGSSIATANDNTAVGNIELTNFDPSGPENASVTPEGSGYAGNFSLDTVSESNGSTSVGWQFSLADDQINVAPNQTVTQAYDVSVSGPQGSAASQAVSVSIGGTGNDNFVFTPGVGADTIFNFNPQHDTIELDHFANAQTVQELQSLIAPDVHGNAVIDLGHGDSITLDGTTPAQLHAILQSAVHLH